MQKNIQQIQMVSLDQLVEEGHIYRKFISLINFQSLCQDLEKELKLPQGADGYGITKLFKVLLLQFMEDLSDRELQKYLKENNAAKWFCDFDLTEPTPHFSLFTKVRKRIGTKRLSVLFSKVKKQLKKQGYINEIFNFVDATHLISKANLWEERDKAIKKKYEKLNNETLPKVAHDPQAKIGCKGKSKFWYGYKEIASVDMQSGLINKVSVRPANEPDAKILKHVCPSQGAVFGDKGFCTSDAQQVLKNRGCHDATIKKNNMKGKDKDKDRWLSKMRSPYERIFSQKRRRVRYRGIAKNQFSGFMEALSFNLKRLVVLESPPLIP